MQKRKYLRRNAKADQKKYLDSDDDFEISSSEKVENQIVSNLETNVGPSDSSDLLESPNTKYAFKSASKKKVKRNVEQDLISWHPELDINWDDIRDQSEERNKNLVKLEQPTALINVKLLPFQKESLSWFIQQENDSIFNGGILADEMGMGKTVQMIALILAQPLKEPTLVVCPIIALLQWRSEIEKYTSAGRLKICIFHGVNRITEKKSLLGFDIILTTYAVVESCYRKQTSGFNRKLGKVYETSILHSIKWGRIILDEAHCIKDRSCSTARSVFALNGTKKWSLSGTPLQNRVGELYSLIRFLHISPYSC